jgi:diacylglycerol O-acyltransferase / wax synthase
MAQRDHADTSGAAVHRMTDTEFVMWTLDEDPALRSDFVNVTLLASPPDEDRLRSKVVDALLAVPHFADRVVAAPLRLAPPEWYPAAEIDLDYHLRKVALPAPGGVRELLDLTAVLAATPFDRTRPLWEFTLVEGLADGRTALIEKVHHAITDGVGALKLSMSLVDFEPDPAAPEHPHSALDDLEPPDPSSRLGRRAHELRVDDPIDRTSLAEVLTDAVGYALGRQARLARATLSAATELLVHPQDAPARATDVLALLGSVRRQVLITDSSRSRPFAQRSLARRYETFVVPFEPAKRAAKTLGGTLNDLYVTGVAGALGRYHERLGEPVEELRMAMPVNLRTDGMTGAGNAFAPTRVLVPVGPKEPAARFAAIRERLGGLRHEPALGAIGSLSGVLAALPPSALLALARLQAATIDFATSNLRGSPVDLYAGGARIDANFPMGPREGSPLNVTMLSYCGELQMGLHLDPAAVTDPNGLLECLEESFDGLLAAGA